MITLFREKTNVVELSYNLSPNLVTSLKSIVDLRRKIILSPMSPKNELRLQWEAQLNRVHWSLALSGNTLTRNQMAEVISQRKTKKLSPMEKETINYKHGLDFIRHNWIVTPNQVTPTTIQRLYDIACLPTMGTSTTTFNRNKKNIKNLLDYLQTGVEHPVIQAGIAQINLINISPFNDGNGRVARLLVYLFLYRSGFDFREMLVLDEYFRRDIVAVKEAIASAQKYNNVTIWLEYFAVGIETQLKTAFDDIKNTKFKTTIPASYWKLNDRQKRVLNRLDNPDEKITNKEVQDMFGVSQITASRDLSKMASLGILFTHGKGRSVYYTRV